MTPSERKIIEESFRQMTAGLLGLESMGGDFAVIRAARKCFEDARNGLKPLCSKALQGPDKGGLD